MRLINAAGSRGRLLEVLQYLQPSHTLLIIKRFNLYLLLVKLYFS